MTSQLGWAAEPDAVSRTPPQTYFGSLRAAGRLQDAAFFLGMALPRHETVGWAARAVRDLGEGRERLRPDADALKAALLWVQDPTEPRRRAAFDAAQLAGTSSAERLAALAAFLSGGSIAPDNVQPVLAAKEAAGRLAAGAILIAAGSGPDRGAAINRALDDGDAIARAGLDSKTP